MLEINNITKKYKKNQTLFTALDDVTFKVEKGDFISVVGPSGSGKSTLLHTIGGLIRPDSGQVLFMGKDVYALNRHESGIFRQKHVGFVFQQFHLMPYLTVYENIKLVCTKPSQQIESYLDKCSLLPLKNKFPSELSVGEKQRTAFIRAIITQPDILLADEPTGNLDPDNSKILMSLIEEFHNNGGTILLVSHDPETSKYASRHISLNSGKLLTSSLI
ncbi:ABC transporter ATP-binding protein [Draconibacterium sp.]